MNNLEGKQGIENPFIIQDEVGTLLFEEYPSTVVFIDREMRPIIREWVDCNEEEIIDRYFYFKTNSNNLNLFIQGHISHKTFVEIAEGQLYYFEDINNNSVINSSLYTGNIPIEYYPGELYISEDDVVNMNSIVSAFYTQVNKFDEIVKKLVREEGAETYNLHMAEGNGVGPGTIKTELLGHSLVNFSSFYQETSLDVLLNKDRGEVSKRRRNELEPMTSTIVYKNLTASYSVLIKPRYSVNHVSDNGENESTSSKIATKVFQLINTSLSYDLLNENAGDYSPKLIESFRIFIDGIKENNVSINLSWYNPESGVLHAEEITHEKAEIISSNIEHLSISSEEALTRIGKFDLVNCSTGHFGFNYNEESITGYFDDTLKDGIRLVNFVDTYTVSIIQTTEKIAGKLEPKVSHVLTAYYKNHLTDTSI